MARRGIVVTDITGTPTWVNVNSIATVRPQAGTVHSSLIAFTDSDEAVWCRETFEEVIDMIERPITKS